MTATVLPAPFEYTALKHLTVYLVKNIVDPANPTRTELDAGHDITRHIPKNGVAGFTKSANTVQADNLSTGGSSSLDDGYTLDASSIQCYMDLTGTNDVRSILEEGDSTHVVFFDDKDVAGNLLDVWPVLCQTISKSKVAGQAMMLTCSFQTNEPSENILVPAAAGG